MTRAFFNLLPEYSIEISKSTEHAESWLTWSFFNGDRRTTTIDVGQTKVQAVSDEGGGYIYGEDEFDLTAEWQLTRAILQRDHGAVAQLLREDPSLLSKRHDLPDLRRYPFNVVVLLTMKNSVEFIHQLLDDVAEFKSVFIQAIQSCDELDEETSVFAQFSGQVPNQRLEMLAEILANSKHSLDEAKQLVDWGFSDVPFLQSMSPRELFMQFCNLPVELQSLATQLLVQSSAEILKTPNQMKFQTFEREIDDICQEYLSPESFNNADYNQLAEKFQKVFLVLKHSTSLAEFEKAYAVVEKSSESPLTMKKL